LFIKNDALNKKLLVTCSNLPNSELKVSEIINEGKKYQITQLATSNEAEYGGINDGFKCLASSPINNEYIISAYHSSEQAPEKSLLVWRLNQRTLESAELGYSKKGTLKRQKVSNATIEPHEKINLSGGVSALKWAGPSRVFAGSYDH
jgi:hypothetical protein